MNNEMENDRSLGIGGIRRRRGGRRFLVSVAAAMFLFVSTAPAFAGTDVLGGNAVLTGMARASLDSNGTSAAVFSSQAASAVLDWSKFNIGSGQSMSFNGASTTFFNLVDGAAGKSQIDGMINGSGNVWVVNPAGIAFGAGSSVNVGGLFAAAAGNLENETALRAGTATTPAFSSFAGTVDVPGGTFSADRVALLGKTVKVDGADMTSVGQLAIGAGAGMTVVDVVGEDGKGTVSINVTEFAVDPSETSVELGSLLLGGGEDTYDIGIPIATRGLEVTAGNGVEVTGTVRTDGNVSVVTKNGDIAVGDNGQISSGIAGEVDLVAGMDVDGSGDVNIDGIVMADTDFGLGAAYIYAGYGTGNVGAKGGDVKVGKNGLVAAGGLLDVQTMATGGKVEAADGSMLVASCVDYTDASLFVDPGTLKVAARDGSVDVGQAMLVAKDAILSASGDVIANNQGNNISGTVSASGASVKLENENGLVLGDVNVSGDFDVRADGVIQQLEESSAVVGGKSSFKTDYVVKVDNDGNDFNEVSASGSQIAVWDANGMTVGDVEATHGNVQLVTHAGDLVVKEGTTVKADAADVYLVAALDDGAKGDVVVNGQVSAVGKNGVQVISGYGEQSSGNVRVNGTGGLSGSSVFVRADGTATDKSVVDVAGSVSAEDYVQIHAIDGEIAVQQGGSVSGGESGVRIATIDPDGVGGDIRIDGDVSAKNGGKVQVISETLDSEKGQVSTGKGDVTVNGTVAAEGTAFLVAGFQPGSSGDLTVNGSVSSQTETLLATGDGTLAVKGAASADKGLVAALSGINDGAKGDIDISGSLEVADKDGIVLVNAANGAGAKGSVAVSGSVKAGNSVQIYAGAGEKTSGSVRIDGLVKGGETATVLTRTGAIAVNGTVDGGTSARVVTGVDNGGSGDVSFGPGGQVRAGSYVDVVTTGGSVQQQGARVDVSRSGFADKKSVPAAVSAPNVGLSVKGDVGSGASYVAVDGTTFAAISGDASIAAADGASFEGGSRPTHTPDVSVSVAEIQSKVDASGNPTMGSTVSTSVAHSIDWGGADDNSSILADGDLAVYTEASLNPYGLLVAGGDLSVSAAKFGDMSYLRAGGRLTINNVGHPSHPQIAYFESVDGKEPRINNQPNDAVIFVDGRLAGGNLQIINKFGATEAFPVSTPELKSEQGIFGNPVFLHGDLDVANPMAVGNVDYMLQEIPRLTLASDFPLEIDKSVNTAGLNPKDVYRFGQHQQVADEKPQAEQQEKKDDKASTEESAEPKVALR